MVIQGEKAPQFSLTCRVSKGSGSGERLVVRGNNEGGRAVTFRRWSKMKMGQGKGKSGKLTGYLGHAVRPESRVRSHTDPAP